MKIISTFLTMLKEWLNEIMYLEVWGKVPNLGTTDVLSELHHHMNNCHMKARSQTLTWSGLNFLSFPSYNHLYPIVPFLLLASLFIHECQNLGIFWISHFYQAPYVVKRQALPDIPLKSFPNIFISSPPLPPAPPQLPRLLYRALSFYALCTSLSFSPSKLAA